MSTTAQLEPQEPVIASTPRVGFALAATALTITAALLYGGTIVGLVKNWAEDGDYSHGFLVPFAVAFFVWQSRPEWRAIPRCPAAIGGMLIIVASQVIYLLGYLGVELFLQRTSMVFCLAGMVVFLLGWRHLGRFSFMLFLLLLAIPLPALIYTRLTLPLQLLASSCAEVLLRVCGVPVFREGNVLELPWNLLNVAEACSGIRSLMTLLTMAAIVAYVLRCRAVWKAVLLASVVPIALAANALRVTGTGLLGQHFGQRAATGFFHLFSGWVVFVVGLAILLAESALIERFCTGRAAR